MDWRDRLAKVMYVVQETSSKDIEYIFEIKKEAEEWIKQFDKVDNNYKFLVLKVIVWSGE